MLRALDLSNLGQSDALSKHLAEIVGKNHSITSLPATCMIQRVDLITYASHASQLNHKHILISFVCRALDLSNPGLSDALGQCLAEMMGENDSITSLQVTSINEPPHI